MARLINKDVEEGNRPWILYSHGHMIKLSCCNMKRHAAFIEMMRDHIDRGEVMRWLIIYILSNVATNSSS